MILTETGGHATWFTGFFTIKRWHVKKCIDYIETIHELNQINIENGGDIMNMSNNE